MAEKLIGPKPIIGPGDSPDVIGGQAQTTEYAPMDENARMAIFGYNPRTGKAFTPAESAAVNGGYNPYAGAIGYQVDPRSGNLNVLKSDGTVMTTGATYRTSSVGGIVPNLPENFTGFGYDEYGRPITSEGNLITDEDIAKYNELVRRDPEAAREFARGKGLSVGTSATGASTSKTSTSTNLGSFVSGAGMTSTGQIQNPYLPGTEAFRAFGERESAYNLLRQQMAAYGLESLVDPLKNLVLEGVSPSEFTIRLRDTDAYKKRFAANAQRINKGLRALSEAEYIGLEDQYQNVMRRYGLPDTYYTRGEMGRQEGFEKFISGDVSPVELEDRIQTAQRRVIDAAPQVKNALAQFYGAELGNGDILAYVLDPEKAIENIKRKITTAEIGAGAMQAGLATGLTRAEELQRYGVTGEQARTGYQTIASYLPRASTLADIYTKQGIGPFTQTTAEAEVFGTPGSVEAATKRRKLTELEQAQFSGQTGVGALARERAGQF
jgi:hypothetical protein